MSSFNFNNCSVVINNYYAPIDNNSKTEVVVQKDYARELELIETQMKLLELKQQNRILEMKLLGIYDYYVEAKNNINKPKENKESFLELGKRGVKQRAFNPKVRLENQKKQSTTDKPDLNDTRISSNFKTADEVVNKILNNFNSLPFFNKQDNLKQGSLYAEMHDMLVDDF